MAEITCISCGSTAIDDRKQKMAPNNSDTYGEAQKKLPINRKFQALSLTTFTGVWLAAASCGILNLARANILEYYALGAILLLLIVLRIVSSYLWYRDTAKRLGKAVTQHHYTCRDCGKQWTWREDKPYPTGRLSEDELSTLRMDE